MYKHFLRPILFLLTPENIHHKVMFVFKYFLPWKWLQKIISSIFSINNTELEKTIWGIRFANPVGLAAGFDKNAEVIDALACLGFGFIEIGTVTPLAQPGNPKPRLFRLKKDHALINRMGFNNQGVDQFIENIQKHKNTNIIIGGNIGKNTATPNELAENDYLQCFEKLYPHVHYFVINVSCPNVANLQQLQDVDFLKHLIGKMQTYRNNQTAWKPILLKISPDLSLAQLDELIALILETKIDGVVAINTTKNRENLLTDSNKIEAIGMGGLSGKPLQKKAIEVVSYISQQTKGKLPIIGVGGISNTKDALAMLNAGASLVQVYTGFIYEGPFIAKKICKGLLKKTQQQYN